MIREKYNLVCRRGHHHYSPNPKYWVGASCGKPFENPLRKDGVNKPTAEKCTELLALIGKV